MRMVIQIAGGQGISGSSPSVDIPQVGYGEAVSNIADIGQSYMNQQEQIRHNKEMEDIYRKRGGATRDWTSDFQ